MHMFAEDMTRFPLAKNAPYKPQPNSLDKYIAFVKEVRLDHTVLVQPEPYQDDESYIEYCFTREPSPGYFKATCLYDPIDPATSARIEALAKRNPNRIVGHAHARNERRGRAYATSGAIKNRDMKEPRDEEDHAETGGPGHDVAGAACPVSRARTGRTVLGIPQCAGADRPLRPRRPRHARGIRRHGGPFQDAAVLHEDLPVTYGSEAHGSPGLRRFRPDRLVWGSYGSSMPAFEKILAQIDDVFDFAPEADRVKIRGGNAMKLFKFQA